MLNRIDLTTDPVQQDKLRRKLGEYRARIAAKAPALDVDLACKEHVLATLLMKGFVEPETLIAEMQSLQGFNPQDFINAVSVVAAYNADEMYAVRGGQGLR